MAQAALARGLEAVLEAQGQTDPQKQEDRPEAVLEEASDGERAALSSPLVAARPRVRWGALPEAQRPEEQAP